MPRIGRGRAEAHTAVGALNAEEVKAGDQLPTKVSAMTASSRRWVRVTALAQCLIVLPVPVVAAYALWHVPSPPAGSDGPEAFAGVILLPVFLAFAVAFAALAAGVCVACFRHTRADGAVSDGVKVIQVYIVALSVLASALTRSWDLLAFAGFGGVVALSLFASSRQPDRTSH